MEKEMPMINPAERQTGGNTTDEEDRKPY